AGAPENGGVKFTLAPLHTILISLSSLILIDRHGSPVWPLYLKPPPIAFQRFAGRFSVIDPAVPPRSRTCRTAPPTRGSFDGSGRSKLLSFETKTSLFFERSPVFVLMISFF